MMQQHASAGLPPRLGRGFHVGKLSASDLEYYSDRLQGIVSYLGRHRPWLLKDPRLSWLAPLWLERLEAPVCVLVVDMQPERLAQHLATQQQQQQQQQQLPDGSAVQEVEVSPATHLERWTNATLSSLKVCHRGTQRTEHTKHIPPAPNTHSWCEAVKHAVGLQTDSVVAWQALSTHWRKLQWPWQPPRSALGHNPRERRTEQNLTNPTYVLVCSLKAHHRSYRCVCCIQLHSVV